MNNKKIRELTDGSIIVAIYLALFLASRLLGGLIEQFLYFIIPIPLIVYGYKYNLKKSLIVSIATTLVSFILISPFTALLYVIPCLVIGLISPILIKKQLNYIIEILILGTLFLMVSLLTSVFFGYIYNYDIIEDTKILAEQILSLIEMIPGEYIEAILISLIPSTIIITSFLEGIILSLVSRILLTRLKMIEKITFNSKYSFDKMPKFIGYIYIIFAIAGIYSLFKIPSRDDLFILYAVVANIFMIGTIYMCYQGMMYILIYCRVHKKRLPYYLGIISLFVFPFIVIILGVLQSTFQISNKIK